MVDSQAKGKRAERDIANYLTRAGLPARRHVRTGTQFEADEGDIRLSTAPVTIESKDYKHGVTKSQVVEFLAKLEKQKRPGDLGLLVCKRPSYSDSGDWLCYVTGMDAGRLIANDPAGLTTAAYLLNPVCFSFADAVRMLVCGSWVEKLVNPFATGVTL